MSIKLFGIPSGYEVDVVLVVAPYFDSEFVKKNF